MVLAVEIVMNVLGEIGKNVGFAQLQLGRPLLSDDTEVGRPPARYPATAETLSPGQGREALDPASRVAPPRRQTQTAGPSVRATYGPGHTRSTLCRRLSPGLRLQSAVPRHGCAA